MKNKSVAPYGNWKSPVSAEMVASSPIYLTHWISQLYMDGDELYALHIRPEEEGRGVVIRVNNGGPNEDLTPMPFSVRSRVYEYGGSGFVVKDGVIYFSNFPDDRLYKQIPGDYPVPITAEGDVRYADMVVDHMRNRIICIREDSTKHSEPTHSVVAVNLDGDEFGTVLFEQTDFVSRPAISLDGRKLAWFAWNHPNMRFYISSVWIADVEDDGSLINIQEIVPEEDEAILDVQWSHNGDLFFCSDRSNWWNLYRWRDGTITHIAPMEAEFDRPFLPARVGGSNNIVAIYRQKGVRNIALVDTETGHHRKIPLEYTFIANIAVSDVSVYAVAASPTQSLRILRIDLRTGVASVVLHSQEYIDIEGYIAAPTQIEFSTENNATAFGHYYPPVNKDFAPPEGDLPPLIVNVHGGPTSSFNVGLNLGVQYWTSRGFAVLEVDYGGSTGYGRAYRKRLWGKWGVVDVQDSIMGASHLIEQGLVDGARTIVRGGSAGGFTTFAALAFRNYFHAGSSHFGISDLEFWNRETHKYESHYCHTLIGPYPECRDLYQERSPINRATEINVPLIIFQGKDDKVVPPNQSQFVADALRKQGVPVAYIEFDGEAHGFRCFETNVRTHQAELAFFSQVFGFLPADELPALTIENLDS